MNIYERKDIEKLKAKSMIDVYEWSIKQLSDISLYGPPTQHVYYFMKLSGETREEALRTDLERLDHWRKILEEKEKKV